MSTRLWGGRFSKDVSTDVKEWTDSTAVDSRMAEEDLWGSMAHVTMLCIQKIIPVEDGVKILRQLLRIGEDFKKGDFVLKAEQDDVHMNVEAEIIKSTGIQVGGKMHTTRSRNDQVILDSKLRTRKGIIELRGKVLDIVETLLERAKDYIEDVMVSYTHIQHAQPISIAYWLTHYAAVFLRDLDRLKRAYDVTDENPLGSGAISGTSFPIDRNLTTKLLGFARVHEHCMDATSSRDFMLETLSSFSILETTFSRLADEFIMWSSYEFGTLTMDDGFSMGSSMMPQKKNPGVCELLRGRAGRVNGLMVAGFTMMKGLPSGYNRDFHEDKEILFDACDLINSAANVVPALLRTTQINKKRMEHLSFQNFATATELANYLVSKHNQSFRQAHHVVGSLVGKLYRAGQNFSEFDICLEHLKSQGINATAEEVHAVLDPKSVMMSYNSLGGTGPESVRAMLTKFNATLSQHRQVYEKDLKRLESAREACRAIAGSAPDDSFDAFKSFVEKEMAKIGDGAKETK